MPGLKFYWADIAAALLSLNLCRIRHRAQPPEMLARLADAIATWRTACSEARLSHAE